MAVLHARETFRDHLRVLEVFYLGDGLRWVLTLLQVKSSKIRQKLDVTESIWTKEELDQETYCWRFLHLSFSAFKIFFVCVRTYMEIWMFVCSQ